MLHELNRSFAHYICCSALSTIVHDCHLYITSILISHTNSGGHGVVVSGHWTLQAEVFDLYVKASFVYDSLLHLQPVGISIELALRIKAIVHSPVDSDVLWSIVRDINRVD